MLVSKNDIIKGLIKYAKQEVLNGIDDKPSKMIAATAVKTIEMYPNLLDQVFNNSILSVVMQHDGDKYDVNNIMRILESTMDEYGSFPVQLPLIKSPLIFNKQDVRRLEDCIKECAEDGELR